MDSCKRFIWMIIVLGFGIFSHAQSISPISIEDTLQSKKEIRKANKKVARKQLKPHVYVSTNFTYASINSQVSFEHSSKLLRAQLDFEDHLGLADSQWFFSFNLIYRITPSSGIFSMYYGLNRDNPVVLEEDQIFLGDTLEAGILVNSYFKTKVFSLGYLLSILKEERAFLGAYFNVYMMKINTGIDSEVFDYSESVNFFAPLPSLGLAMAFELTPWLTFSGNVGMFFANLESVSGSIHDISASLSFNPTQWLGFSLGYNIFDVRVQVPDSNFNTIIDYNFSGPSLGLTFRF